MRVRVEDLTDVYGFVDPASGRGREPVKRVRARSAIVVVGGDALQRFFVLLAWAERCSVDRLTDRIFEVHEQFRPRAIGVETNAMQALYEGSLAREARLTDRPLPLRAVDQPTKIEKAWRIRSALQPVIGHGRLFIQEHQVELKAELSTFPMSSRVDLVDALASVIAMFPQRATRRERSREKEDLLAYLRETGADPTYIQQVADEREPSEFAQVVH